MTRKKTPNMGVKATDEPLSKAHSKHDPTIRTLTLVITDIDGKIEFSGKATGFNKLEILGLLSVVVRDTINDTYEQ